MPKTSQQFKDKATTDSDAGLDPDSWAYAIKQIQKGHEIEKEEVRKFVERGDELFGKPNVPDEFL